MSPSRSDITRSVKLVLFFDICSSSKIVEDLSAENAGYMEEWRSVLREMQKLMERKEQKFECEAYKFLGDGWIMILPQHTSGEVLWEILSCIATTYADLYDRHIRDSLSRDLKDIGDPGITFGVADGLITRMELRGGQTEWVGRALNVAARLQAAVKERDDAPQNKALISRKLFNRLGLRDILAAGDYKFTVRTLRNISYDYGMRCAKVAVPCQTGHP